MDGVGNSGVKSWFRHCTAFRNYCRRQVVY